VLFTPALIQAAHLRSESYLSDPVLGSLVFFLITEVTCLLGLLLWGTPLILSELEANSWLYVAVRPGGRLHLLLGKYANAVLWVFMAAFTSMSLTAISSRYIVADVFPLWAVVVILSALGSLSYGALFCLIAVAFPKRSMVIAVSYVLVFEFLVSFVPATINRLTILYRLRTLLMQWMGWMEDLPPSAQLFLSDAPAWYNVMVVLGFAAAYLALAALIIQLREYLTHVPD